MDLSFTAEQEAFAAEAATWLDAKYTPPPPFEHDAEAVAWGRRWQARLAADRWVGIDWPEEYGGRGATPVEVALFNLAYARTGAPQPVNRVGLSHAGPTLLAHGTDAQKQRFLPAILTAEEIWCQLFSEPDAGSDLAALRTRAERIEGGWSLTGQKVWTSYATVARWGICLARTDPDTAPSPSGAPGARKHAGISYLIVDMEADGIEVRPLRQLTGEAEFSEVFLESAFVPDDHVVGAVDDGWSVAATTLAYERGVNFPFKEQVVHEVHFDRLFRAAAEDGRLDDLLVAEDLGQVYTELRLLALANLRTMTRLSRGETPGAESSRVKLAWTTLTQHLSALAVELFPDDEAWQRQWLWSRAASIAGGTSEIQRTILADRLLGLPR
ncbi:MAG: acyl-CoA dehydrogenase family protein [Actinobacteria bacterium]|nr:acyl-CoA dehydrogenase family protein [Actinomycetota bacterium]